MTGEYYCRIFSEFFGVETACLRYFNVFGPKQALDDEYAVVVPKFIHCIMNDQPPPIFGSGKQSRDFTFISNVVSANVLAATTPGIKHEIFNVANGRDNTVLNLVDTLNKIMGKNIEPKFLAARAGDVFKTKADISGITGRLNYKPLVGFEDGLKKTVEHFTALSAKRWNQAASPFPSRKGNEENDGRANVQRIVSISWSVIYADVSGYPDTVQAGGDGVLWAIFMPSIAAVSIDSMDKLC